MNNRSKLLRAALIVLLAAMAVAGSARLALRAVGWWIDSSDRPVKSDVMVVLAGDYARPVFAAELYAQGLAPEVWISRPKREKSLAKLESLGIHLPREEDINREILVKRGVPTDRVRFYGRDVNSTADEADALRREYPVAGKSILVVTSRFHVRRSRLIFQRLLPDADVRVVAEPQAPGLKWWKDKDIADNAILEPVKTLYFLIGGRMK